MIYTFGDDIHATAWWYTTAFAMDKKMQVNSTCIFWRRGQDLALCEAAPVNSLLDCLVCLKTIRVYKLLVSKPFCKPQNASPFKSRSVWAFNQIKQPPCRWLFYLAERTGFEPARPVKAYPLSKRAHSTALTSLQNCLNILSYFFAFSKRFYAAKPQKKKFVSKTAVKIIFKNFLNSERRLASI